MSPMNLLLFLATMSIFAAPQWTLQTSGATARLRGVSAVRDRVAWASGADSTVLRTTDGGASWRKIETGVQTGLVGGTVTDDGRIVLVSQSGHLLVSTDDGATFTTIKVERPFPATAVVSPGKDALALAGLFGVTEITIK